MFSILRKFPVLLLFGIGFVPCALLANEPDRALRDPTRPLNYRAAVEKQDTLTLQAIFTGKDRKEAIINGLAVSEGETIGNARVVDIGEKQVRYIMDGKSHILRLRPSITTR